MTVVFDIDSFQPVLGKVGIGKFRHTLSRVKSMDSSRTWISKEMTDPNASYRETLAQEFFRLIIPHQPVTIIAKNKHTNIYFVLSEEVSGFKGIPRNAQRKFKDGTYTGLGQILLTSLIVQEVDLKNGNIGINNKNELIKIDGDWSFSTIIDPNKFSPAESRITPALISGLPYLNNFYAFNWLDLIKKEVNYDNSIFVDHELTNNHHFRAEVNEAILRVVTLPDEYLVMFVDAYIPVGCNADRYVNFLKLRRDNLLYSALQNKSFRDYLVSEQARLNASNHLAHLNSFTAGNNVKIISKSNQNTIEREYLYRAISIMSFANSNPKENHLWNGFVAGFVVAVGVASLLLALRIIDVATLGLSLPVTIAASTGIVALVSVAFGMVALIIQNLVDLFRINKLSASLSGPSINTQSGQLTVDSIRAEKEYRTKVLLKHTDYVKSILGNQSIFMENVSSRKLASEIGTSQIEDTLISNYNT